MSLINDAVAFVNSSALFGGTDAVAEFQAQILDALNASAAALVPSQYPEVAAGYALGYQTLAEEFLPEVAQVELLLSVMGAGTITVQAAMQHPFRCVVVTLWGVARLLSGENDCM
jgi:choline dehydrogenase